MFDMLGPYPSLRLGERGSADTCQDPHDLRDTARAMSQENVEIVRASFEAWNTGDMDALRELYALDAVLQPAEGWHEPRPYVGRDAVMQLVARVRETWDSYDAAEPISFVDAGDRVVMRYIWRGRGRGPVMNLEQTVV